MLLTLAIGTAAMLASIAVLVVLLIAGLSRAGEWHEARREIEEFEAFKRAQRDFEG